MCAYKILENPLSASLCTTPKPCLSLVLIAKNEATCIARCLDSARGLADELIVVDTGSEDETVSIATNCGARVLHFDWCDDFSAARNAGLEAARGRWILVLDADEYLPEASVSALMPLIHSSADRAYHLLNKSSSDGGKTGMVAKIIRLFPNRPEIRFEWPVHEQVATSLSRNGIPILDSAIKIIHTGYSSPVVNACKQVRNLQILEKTTSSVSHPHPMLLFLQGGALLDLGRISEAFDFYKRCSISPDAGSELTHGAVVRMCTCLAMLEKPEDILSLAPSSPTADWHPELLLHIGTSLIQTGRTKQGIELLLQAMACQKKVLIPAYDPLQIGARCMAEIANGLEKNDLKSAISLLRLAAKSIQEGQEISLDEVRPLLQRA